MTAISFSFDDTFVVTSRKHDRSVEIDVRKLPTASLVAIFDYGLQRIINDAANAGGKDATADSWSGNAQKKVDSLLAGETRQARESDPVRAEARNMARAAVMRDLKRVNKKPEDLAEGHFPKLVNDRIARFMDAAAAVVAARRAAQPADEGMDDILALLG